MFMQPVAARRCAARMGYEFHYDSTPNRETYASLLGLSDLVRERIASLEPKDNIDMQSFIYVIGKEPGSPAPRSPPHGRVADSRPAGRPAAARIPTVTWTTQKER
jgi:hypothetical protein